MANEFFRTFGPDAAISLTPGANGRLEIRLDDELIFDKKSEDNKFPDLGRIRELKKVVAERLESLSGAAAD